MLLGDDEDSLALVFQHVKPEDAGIYTCVAKTSTGNISCSAELTVQGNRLIRSILLAFFYFSFRYRLAFDLDLT